LNILLLVAAVAVNRVCQVFGTVVVVAVAVVQPTFLKSIKILMLH
jgi:hypothetical protein